MGGRRHQPCVQQSSLAECFEQLLWHALVAFTSYARVAVSLLLGSLLDPWTVLAGSSQVSCARVATSPMAMEEDLCRHLHANETVNVKH